MLVEDNRIGVVCRTEEPDLGPALRKLQDRRLTFLREVSVSLRIFSVLDDNAQLTLLGTTRHGLVAFNLKFKAAILKQKTNHAIQDFLPFRGHRIA